MLLIPTVPREAIPGYCGDWGGGRHGGYIFKQKNSIVYAIEVNKKKVKTSFLISRYGTEETARITAATAQVQISLALDMTKNRYRYHFDDMRQEYFLEVSLTLGKSMFCCLCHNYLSRGAWCADRSQGDAYAQSRIQGKNIRYHQLVTGAAETDHRDGNTLNNRCYNLHSVTHQENMKNTVMRKNNSSGRTGVHFDMRKNGFIAQWRINGKPKIKMFTVGKYGQDEAFRRACEARSEIENQLGLVTRPPKRPLENQPLPEAKFRRLLPNEKPATGAKKRKREEEDEEEEDESED